MIRRHLKKTRAQSVIEFTALMLFILGSLLVFQKYIVRGLAGRWKSIGDGLGEGRIYDPHRTVECAYKTFFQGDDPVWFNQDCFEENCEEECLRSTKSSAACLTCLTVDCQASYCDDDP